MYDNVTMKGSHSLHSKRSFITLVIISDTRLNSAGQGEYLKGKQSESRRKLVSSIVN